jgi:hypothetical protein
MWRSEKKNPYMRIHDKHKTIESVFSIRVARYSVPG